VGQKINDVSGKEAHISVTSTLGRFVKKDKNKKIRIRPFVTDTASVSVKGGLTIPTGDYESARFDVMITLPCYVEELAEVYKKTREMVEKLIDKEVESIEKEMSKK
jgi:hypothetical protein